MQVRDQFSRSQNQCFFVRGKQALFYFIWYDLIKILLTEKKQIPEAGTMIDSYKLDRKKEAEIMGFEDIIRFLVSSDL